MEEGARFVDELANGRGRSAGDKPEHLLRARPRTARRHPRDPLCPPGRRGVVPSRGRGSRGRGGRRGAYEQGEAAVPPPCPGFRREGKTAGRGLRRGGAGGEQVERAEVDGGGHRMERARRGRSGPRRRANEAI